MNATLEIISDSKSLVTLGCNGYVIQLQRCDLDRACHGGLNVLLPTGCGEYEPVPKVLNGADVFVIENMTGSNRPGECGWLILATDLQTAINYCRQ